MITVERAPAYATIQDAGRRGFLSSGVPISGAMDRRTLDSLNALIGNDIRAAGIEWALSAGALRFNSHVTFAFGGADCPSQLNAAPLQPYRAYHAVGGDVLSIRAPSKGRFLYLAISGGLDCPIVMGSRSTYIPGGFGGIGGRRFVSGDVLPVAAPARRKRHQVSDVLPKGLRPSHGDRIRFIPREGVSPSEWATDRFMLSANSDRTGYRLTGAASAVGASITSEPVCPGVIQLPPDGEPIVLMADAPTIGGYRIAGVVISADLGALAQRVPGASVTLVAVTVAEAQREIERQFETLARIREWSLAV